MQKDVAKVMLKAAGVPVPEGVVVSRFEAAKAHPLPRPYVIKPIAEGSSVGVFIVTEAHEHPPQELYRDDWTFGDRVLVEAFIAGKELTCAVMGDEALGVIEIVPTVRFYDYEAKYAPGGSNTSATRSNFTKCLPRGPKTGACGASCPRLPGREPCRFPLRRPRGGDGGSGLPRGQHPARHDRNVARARACGPCGHNVR